MSQDEREARRQLETILRRGRGIEPETVALSRCPECRDFGIPPDARSYRFCLLCSWREDPSKASADSR